MLRPRFSPATAFLALALAAAPAAAFDRESADTVNSDQSGVALRGYDPVAYFTSGAPVKGDAQFAQVYKDHRYLFASEADRAAFAADPEKYIPAYGGFCSYAASFGKKADGDPEAWRIVGGKLYLNVTKDVAKIWSEDVPGYTRKADAAWPRISTKAPGDL